MRIWNPISYRGGNQTRTGAPMRPQCPRPARPENHHHHFRLIPSELSTLASSCVRIICIHHHHFRLIPSELYTLANSCVRIICIWIGHDSTTVRFWGSGSSRAEPGPPSAGFCAIPSEARSDRRLIALSGGFPKRRSNKNFRKPLKKPWILLSFDVLKLENSSRSRCQSAVEKNTKKTPTSRKS